MKIDYHLLKRALTGWENECGDIGVIHTDDKSCFLGLVDVLGHGKKAYDIAIFAKQYLMENYQLDLIDMMNGLHLHLKGTLGAVAALCRINLINGVMRYVGVGNISTRLYPNSPMKFIPKDGIIGYLMTSPKEQIASLYPGDILILSSDGVKENFDLANYPTLLTGNAQTIATNLMDNLGKGNDDSSCIVLRYGI